MVHTARIPEIPDLVAERQTNSLAALAVTLGLIVIGLFLVNALRATPSPQDCARAGCHSP